MKKYFTLVEKGFANNHTVYITFIDEKLKELEQIRLYENMAKNQAKVKELTSELIEVIKENDPRFYLYQDKKLIGTVQAHDFYNYNIYTFEKLDGNAAVDAANKLMR